MPRPLDDGRPLTLPPDELRRLGYRVVDAIAEHWETIGDAPPIRTGTPEGLYGELREPPPDGPGDPHAAIDRLLEHVAPFVQHPDHPRFFARVPSPSNPVSALGDALASGLNILVASWTGGSGPTALELVVLDWLRSWCGLPPETEGIFVSGGSVGTLTALAAAPRGTAYVSDQTHASVLRALRLLGNEVRVLPSDEQFRLVPDAVVSAMLRDTDPAIVVATAGTTNTGAVDPIHELADLCAHRGLWLHVDGAYGAPAVLTERGRPLLSGIERADSLVLDPHKWLFQPYEAGVVLVRRPGALAEAFAMSPEYLRDTAHGGEVDFRDRGPQLSRGTRALKLWLSLQTFGLEAFRSAIARGIALAEEAEAAVASSSRLEVVTPAQLGIVTFAAREADNAELVARVIEDGYAAPSSTVLRGRTVLRLCTINPRTTSEEIRETVARIDALAAS